MKEPPRTSLTARIGLGCLLGLALACLAVAGVRRHLWGRIDRELEVLRAEGIPVTLEELAAL